jgi:glyoxylase-like metal-dependent hydrolase (beta-lactamase superfamily II)
MQAEAFAAPPFFENAYLLICPETRDAAIIDPGDGIDQVIETAQAAACRVTRILLTHAHLDHISGVQAALDAFGPVPVHLHPADRFLYDAVVEQGRMFGFHVDRQPPPDAPLSPGDRLQVGRLRIQVHHTPGHSPGGVVFEVIDPSEIVQLFAGDTLFAGSIGRTDLPGGDYATLIASIRSVLFAFDDETTVYPGHGDPTTIGRERRTNPFLL